MPSEHDKASVDRRLTLSELCLYVSGFCASLVMLRGADLSFPPEAENVFVGIAVVAIGCLGASLGTPLATLIAGRQSMIYGAMIGAVVAPVFLAVVSLLLSEISRL